jgi:nucleotide-binding universal stress UspA family protein
MSRPILVGFDPVDRDRAPVYFGVAMARVTGAALIVASVESGAPTLPVPWGQSLDYAVGMPDSKLVADCADVIEEIDADLRASGIHADCSTLRSTSAARALHEAAESEDAGLIVVGAAGRGAEAHVAGSATADRLMHGAPCPVASVPRSWGGDSAIATIAVAFVDGGEARAALRGAWALARRARAALRVVTVVRDGDPEGRRRAEEELRAVADGLGGDVPVDVAALAGDPVDELIRLSDEVDVLVCGSRGYGPLRAVMLGSVSRRVVARAHCPVIAVPRGVQSTLEDLIADAPAAVSPVPS